MSSVYQIYRSTSIGLALDETLGDLLHRQLLTRRSVQLILSAFDRAMNRALSSRSVQGKKQPCLLFKGHLLSYRACDQVWTLVFDSLTFTSTSDPSWSMDLSSEADKIKIIACPMSRLFFPSGDELANSESDHETKPKVYKKLKTSQKNGSQQFL